MTQCIDPSDSRYFRLSCEKPYDRHNYKIVFSNGNGEEYESWEEVQLRWFQTPSQFLSHVDVLDKVKGFK
jgi:hypothetical protein|tara:strand:- start:680 stop:889 length:210 start_codon:yes stop_codon:yes gene_type:complete